jgi:T5SS/PEP-CTERM-associated repeat protein
VKVTFSLALFLPLAGFAASASSTEWILSGNGSWEVSAHWSAGVPNLVADAVTIATVVPVTVTVDDSASESSLAIGRLNLGGAGGVNRWRLDHLGARPFRLTDSINVNPGGEVDIVESQLVLDGTLSGGGFHLNAGGLTVRGGAWRVTGGMTRIGRTGTAAATVEAGEFVTDRDVTIGEQSGSAGSLVLKSGVANIGGTVFIADDAGSTGRLSVEGGTFTVTGPRLRIGDDGEGQMELTAGLAVVDDVSVGRGAGSVGTFRITGGWMRSGDLSIGRFAGARGLVEVQGGTLELLADSLFVGREGEGEFRLAGGNVSAAEVVVASVPGAAGKLVVAGGHLAAGQWVAERPGAVVMVTGGVVDVTASRFATGTPLVIGDGVHPATLRLGTGAHVFADGLVIEAGARLEGEGVVQGPLTVRGLDARGGAKPVPTAPEIRWAFDQSGWVLEVNSVVGWNYRVETVDDGVWGNWGALDTGVAGNGGPLRLPVVRGPGSRVLRVRLDPQ